MLTKKTILWLAFQRWSTDLQPHKEGQPFGYHDRRGSRRLTENNGRRHHWSWRVWTMQEINCRSNPIVPSWSRFNIKMMVWHIQKRLSLIKNQVESRPLIAHFYNGLSYSKSTPAQSLFLRRLFFAKTTRVFFEYSLFLITHIQTDAPEIWFFAIRN